MPTSYPEFLIAPANGEARGPCAGGLLAGTLALMTAWAAPATDARLDAQHQRELIAHKIVANLAMLGAHPDIGPALRQVIGRVAERWASLAEAAGVAAAADDRSATPAVPVHWH